MGLGARHRLRSSFGLDRRIGICGDWLRLESGPLELGSATQMVEPHGDVLVDDRFVSSTDELGQRSRREMTQDIHLEKAIARDDVALFSRKVVGWTLADRMTASLVCDALDAAVRLRRPKPGLIFHSDRGSQYASKAFRRRLWRYRMRQSMSAKGNCYDNAVAESFFATLKKELVRDEPFQTRTGARGEVFEYIEVFYNRKRAHSLLGYESPTSFEACFTNTDVA